MSKTVRVVFWWCGTHWYATAWIVLAAYLLICGVIRPNDDGLFMMIAAPIGACAFMIAFFSPVFIKEESDANAPRRVIASRAPVTRAVNRARFPHAAVASQTGTHRSRVSNG
jgi:hypothetical protein